MDDSATNGRQNTTFVPLAMENNMQILWDDGERIFCRELRSSASGESTVLVARPAAEQPLPACLGRLAHELP